MGRPYVSDYDETFDLIQKQKSSLRKIITPFTFDSAGLRVQALPIIGASVSSNTITVAGDKRYLLPSAGAGGAFTVDTGPNSGASAIYFIDSTALVGGNTVIHVNAGTPVQSNTVTGNVITIGQAEFVVGTVKAGEIILGYMVSVQEAWDNANVSFNLGFRGSPFTLVDADPSVLKDVDTELIPGVTETAMTVFNASSMYRIDRDLDVTAVTMGGGGDPYGLEESTAGAGTLIFLLG